MYRRDNGAANGRGLGKTNRLWDLEEISCWSPSNIIVIFYEPGDPSRVYLMNGLESNGKDLQEIAGICIKRVYDERFTEDVAPQVRKEMYEFFCSDEVRTQLERVADSDEIWIKPNFTNPRPPQTGTITHPIVVEAMIDCLVDSLRVKSLIRIVETDTFHKGPGITEVIRKLPDGERKAIESKLASKDPNQDPHDFGFNLLLELGGIPKLLEDYRRRGVTIDILNLSREPLMTPEERQPIIEKLERLIGKEAIPTEKVRKKLVENIPKLLGGEKKIGLISLTMPKTQDLPGAWMTGTTKNIALGLFPKYKAFMHADIARAIIFNYGLWKMALDDRVFGVISGPYGQDYDGPIFGRTVQFPYIVAGSDLLRVDSAVNALCFGKSHLIDSIELFKLGRDKIGEVVSREDLEKLIPHALNFSSYPYETGIGKAFERKLGEDV
jgi:hypothetical protein